MLTRYSVHFSAPPPEELSTDFFPGFEATLPLNNRLILVCGCDEEEKLRALTHTDSAAACLRSTLDHWQKLSRLRVNTAHPALDRYINTWGPYQAQACRIMGRTSIYQSGGAIGFRDQLQDAVSLLLINPKQCRKFILNACRHQYREGDVMHWWHPHPTGDRGVRTHCSDDLLWLPWAVCEYVDQTGDSSILTETTSWLDSPAPGEHDRDRYEIPAVTEEQSTVEAHCRQALDMVISRGTGSHGLAKMLGGDWNDGMDKVNGESVWLSWFFAHTADRFARLTGDEKYRSEAEKHRKAAEEAWDADHWLRGYFADGTPLGESAGDCCKIDSIAQSFACLCPQIDEHKLHTALDSALAALRKGKLTELFSPPFSGNGPDPGYIRSYGPGFRENGGQYTHAAIWLAMACLKTGKRAEGEQILLDILPEGRDNSIYGAEPFVIPADVSSNESHFGHAGWTWYTGSAGWYWRVVIQDMLGIVPRAGRLHIDPKGESFAFSWTSSKGETFRVSVEGDTVTVNGSAYDGKGLPL